MIELLPKTYAAFSCPECGSQEITVNELLFPGLHVVGKCACSACKFEFLHSMPVGHSIYYPIIYGLNNQKLYGKQIYSWYHEAFARAYQTPNTTGIALRKTIQKTAKKVILLNCIDYLYGHVLLKLLNADAYLRDFPEYGLIILIPSAFKWMVPEGAAEIWTVDLPLSRARDWYPSLDAAIKDELKRFEQVQLSLAFSHPDTSKIDISLFTKTKRFDLTRYNETAPAFTFIAREDRLWFDSPLGLNLFTLVNHFPALHFLKSIFIARQNKKIIRLFEKIKQALPGASFSIIGLGKKQPTPDFISDLRETKLNDEIELKWCAVYAGSHVVFGIHGSNMLIPSALAAGFIEILPESRLPNFLQDTTIPYKGAFYQFLCRFIPEFTGVENIAAMAVSMINDFAQFDRRYSEEFNKHSFYTDVRKWLE